MRISLDISDMYDMMQKREGIMKTKEKKTDKNEAYRKAVARMESEVKRAQAHVTLLKMLYRELQEKNSKVGS